MKKEKIEKQRRHAAILQILRSKSKDDPISPTELHEKLVSMDIETTPRTVNRDIKELSDSYGFSEEGEHPTRYFLSKDYKIKREITLDEQGLQILLIALENLKQTSHQFFNIYTGEVETSILNSLDSKTAQELINIKKYYHFDFGVSGKPEKSEINEFKKVMEAFRKRLIFTCKNISPYKDAAYNQRIRKFAPLKFILSTGIPYLMAQDQDDKQIKNLRLTRLTEVKLTDEKVADDRLLKNLKNLESLIGGFGGTSEKTVEMELIGDSVIGNYFSEKKIHKSQEVIKLKRDNLK